MDIARCVETTGECDPGPRAPSTSTRQIHLQSYSQLTASQQPRDSISEENSAVPCKIPTVVLVNFPTNPPFHQVPICAREGEGTEGTQC